jgi:hypothetical protein
MPAVTGETAPRRCRCHCSSGILDYAPVLQRYVQIEPCVREHEADAVVGGAVIAHHALGGVTEEEPESLGAAYPVVKGPVSDHVRICVGRVADV